MLEITRFEQDFTLRWLVIRSASTVVKPSFHAQKVLSSVL